MQIQVADETPRAGQWKHWMSGFSFAPGEAKNDPWLQDLARFVDAVAPERHASRYLAEDRNKDFRRAVLPVLQALIRGINSGKYTLEEE